MKFSVYGPYSSASRSSLDLIFSGSSDPMAKQSEVVFQLLQKDLAGRSKYGQLLEAKKSGHYIQRDEPELVTQSIKDVIRESVTPIQEKPGQ
jgi:hypothetical protein